MPNFVNVCLQELGTDELELFTEKILQQRSSETPQVDDVGLLLSESTTSVSVGNEITSSSSTGTAVGGDDEGEGTSSFSSSYAKLPPHLKSCFDYCCCMRTTRGFIDMDEVVRLIVAEGLVQENKGENIIIREEDIAANTIQELICLGMLEEIAGGGYLSVPSNPHKLSIGGGERENLDVAAAAANSLIRLFISISRQHKGRVPIPSNLKSLPICSLSVSYFRCPSAVWLDRGSLETICKLKHLLVLNLHCIDIECLPDEVGDLVHLTYLGLFSASLKELPRTISNLQKLQTLAINFCDNIRELSVEVLKIRQLRHILMFYQMDGAIRVPKGIGSMLNLQTLYGVYARGGIAAELGNLTKLRKLGVFRVSEDHASELFAAIMKMENLVSLSLRAEGDVYYPNRDPALLPSPNRDPALLPSRIRDPALLPDLELFSPPSLLQELDLTGILIEMPDWLSSMVNLTQLRLSDSYLSDYPTSILQLIPQLKHLTLLDISNATQIGKEFCKAGGFPKLETLLISSELLVAWTEIVNGAFPSLRSLSLYNFRSLRVFPEGLQHISMLKNLYMCGIHHDLIRRLNGEENYKIKNIANVQLEPFDSLETK